MRRPTFRKTKGTDMLKRILYFSIGLVLACYMFVYSFQYQSFPDTITFLGYDMTMWIMIAVITILGFAGCWLMQIAILSDRQ